MGVANPRPRPLYLRHRPADLEQARGEGPGAGGVARPRGHAPFPLGPLPPQLCFRPLPPRQGGVPSPTLGGRVQIGPAPSADLGDQALKNKNKIKLN